MKKKILCVLVSLMLLVVTIGCGSPKVIDGKEYDTYGLLNIHSNYDENIKYQTIVGNVVWGFILFETIVGPIYFFGFSMYEPVGKKDIK